MLLYNFFITTKNNIKFMYHLISIKLKCFIQSITIYLTDIYVILLLLL